MPIQIADIQTRLQTIIGEQLDVGHDMVVPTAKLADDLGADSLDLVELVMAAEDEFGIDIPDEDCAKLHTVQDLADLVKRIVG